MDLYQALPRLRHHPLLSGKRISLVGVSTIVRDDARLYFEIGKPKYWRRREGATPGSSTTVVGVGGIGGALEPGESVVAGLRREVEEELGARVRLEPTPRTYLILEWQVADILALPRARKRLPPLLVILIPPRLGGSDTPDYLAILAFRSVLRDRPEPQDLFGLLGIHDSAVSDFFGRDEMPLEEAEAHPGLTISATGRLPSGTVLRPVLTARAFQVLVRAGYGGLSRA
jgi:8-oxo-dGTP pyrophosphatase MutT (NUDIX family)